MRGFFDLPKEEDINRLKGKPVSCASCGLYRHVKSPRMKPFGKFKRGILNIGEAPGEMEDSWGKQWHGKVGRLLQRTYRKLGIDVFEDCININAVNCLPLDKKGNSRSPSEYEVACCRSRVWDVIKEYKPKVIVLLGNLAVASLIGHRWQKDRGGIAKWRGWIIPDQDTRCWVCPTFHPSYIDRLDTKESAFIWEQDLSRAFSMLDEPFPSYKDPEKCVHIIDSLIDLPGIPDMVAFDYETTGLRPYAHGHRIVCASLAYNEDEAYTFMLTRHKDIKRFSRILADKSIRKIAHNMKFEDTWSLIRLSVQVQNWYWDSMIASHILDNRHNITGLKFQTYVNFGVVDYDSDIAPYLKAKDPKDINSFNRVLELIKSVSGRKKLLTYCGLDSLFTYRLAMKQMREIGYAC